MQRFFIRNIASFSSKATKEAEINSVEGHKPPVFEDTVHGKYAGVLFSAASQASALHSVLQDMKLFSELSKNSEVFRNFLVNVQFSRENQMVVFKSMQTESLSPITWNFLSTIIENKRVEYLPKMAEKFIDYYKILNKEENITIISAQELTPEEQKQVVDALKQQNSTVQFTVQYQVDETILGGLQMYSGNKFLDCSLLSRVNRIRTELQRVSI